MALMAAASLLALWGVARRRGGGPGGGIDLHFFALGGGFMLLETRGLTVVALHLGSTWSVNAAVFAGVLVMALLATVAGARLARGGARGICWPAYAALGLLLLLSHAVGQASLAALPGAARVLCGVLLIALPLGASGIIFALGLARTGMADRALASNLLGAMAGGLLEYGSMIWGFRALVLLGALLYLLALAADLRARRASPQNWK